MRFQGVFLLNSLSFAKTHRPGDAPAMTSAFAVKVSLALFKSPSQVAAETLYALLQDLKAHKESGGLNFGKALIDGFNSSDPRYILTKLVLQFCSNAFFFSSLLRPFLAGDLFVASGLKPLAAILSGLSTPSPALARAILGYGFYISAGRKFREPQDRKDALVSILDIRKERELNPGEPGTPDPVQPVYYREFDVAILRQCAGLAPEFGPDAIRAACVAALAFVASASSSNSVDGFLTEFKKLLEEVSQGRLNIFGTPSKEEEEDVVGALAVQAIRSPELSSRVKVSTDNSNEREYRFPDVRNSQEVVGYIGREVSLLYASRYEAALKQKRFEEEAIKSRQLIQSLLEAPTQAAFIELLNAPVEPNSPSISSRSSPGYAELIRSLLDLSDAKQDVPARLQKIWVLILGRDSKGQAVWNLGNALREDLFPYHKVFEQLEPSGSLWEELRTIHSQYAKHVYRSSNVPNRHGHSNLLPSWWARGYSSPDAFKVRTERLNL